LLTWWWQPPCLVRAVIVNRKDDPTTALRGVLWSSRGSWLVLRDASVLAVNAPPRLIDGEIVIHRSNVAFLQVLPE
jgi:hypothetical protein